jgi:subtilase family serine protease
MYPGNQPHRAASAGIHPYIHHQRPQQQGGRHKPYIKFRDRSAHAANLLPRAAAAAPWNPVELCKEYSWPQGDAPGQGVIAIVELGGGWTQDDLTAFFAQSGLDASLMPAVTDVSVDGTATNSPGQDPNADGEVALDIQVAAAAYAFATGRPATIRMYWASNSLGAIAAAVRAATADGCDVCSISWGSDEANWGAQAGNDMELAAQAATDAGMVVFAASGDNDSSDGGPNPANVDLPASCPHVVGCGGTRRLKRTDPNEPLPEFVWNDTPGNPSGEGTGGGFSTLFPMPDFQVAPNGPGRMVPDVAANADPVTGYNIVLAGTPSVVGGTSAVAPLYAGLFAAFGTKLGFITPTLYKNQTAFNDVTLGDNGAFRAGVGPDPCTGIGSPIGDRLDSLLIAPTAANIRILRNRLRQPQTAAPRRARSGSAGS